MKKSTENFLWNASCVVVCVAVLSFIAWVSFDEIKKTWVPDECMTTQEYSDSVQEDLAMRGVM